MLLKCSIPRTIYYNFRHLPINQAIKLPLAVGRNTQIVNYGIIILPDVVSPFMVSLGIIRLKPFESYSTPTKIYNEGTIYIKGAIRIHPGAKIWVGPEAELFFQGFNIIGAENKIACHKKISFGRYTGTSWQCEIFDTDFHYTKDLVSGKIYNKVKPISIGDEVFIGNNVNIGKGVKLPDGSIVSSWSNVSGSFMKAEKAPLIQGPKATVVDSGYYIAQGFKMDLDRKFGEEYIKTHNGTRKENTHENGGG